MGVLVTTIYCFAIFACVVAIFGLLPVSTRGEIIRLIERIGGTA